MSKKKERFEDHYRLSRSQGGKTTKSNISFVRKSQHVAWHTLFPGDMKLETIVHIINTVWIRPDKKLIVEDREVPNEDQPSLFTK